MRLFVAIEIPSEIQLELERRTAALRSSLPGARWVKPRAMHLTLAFLGDTDQQLLPELHRELGAAFAAGRRMTLNIGAIGAFPPRGRKRVLWAGVEAAGDLGGLQAGVAEAVERAAGIEVERRPYHPHLTLARCKPPWSPAAVARLAAAFGEEPAGAFTAGHGSLIASRLLPTATASIGIASRESAARTQRKTCSPNGSSFVRALRSCAWPRTQSSCRL